MQAPPGYLDNVGVAPNAIATAVYPGNLRIVNTLTNPGTREASLRTIASKKVRSTQQHAVALSISLGLCTASIITSGDALMD